jgi:hypothetical protein
VTTITEADLTPVVGEPDHRFAGEPLDSWLGYVPEDSVKRAIEVAVERPGLRVIAFATLKSDDKTFATYIDHQRRAGRAFVAEEYSHLKVKLLTTTAPFRGVGPDMRVFYVLVGTAK